MTEDGKGTIGCIIVGLCIALYGWFPDSNLRYNMTYDLISSEHVHVQSKPTNCDWGHAPLGGKGCHFEKSVDEQKSSVTDKVTDVYVQWSRVED